MSISFSVQPAATMALMSCPLCCEDKPVSAVCRLTTCSHESCGECMVKWIEKAEASGQDEALPGCPFCRVPLTQDEAVAILGRPFQPARPSRDGATAAAAEEEMDELTLQWLQEQTKPCPRCGALIEKLQGGCDMMECLCGYRFCYQCGSQGAKCSCSPPDHSFWDNILDRHAGNTEAQEAPEDEETGSVNLLVHIKMRKKQEADNQLRQHRKYTRENLEYEVSSMDDTTISAKWLFLPEKAGLRVLEQQTAGFKKHDKRSSIHRDIGWELRRSESYTFSTSWLFLPTNSASTKALSQILLGGKTHRDRGRRKKYNTLTAEADEIGALAYSARWLFCNQETGTKMLAEQDLAESIRQEREINAMDRRDELEDLEERGCVVQSGRWLFWKRSREKTLQVVDRLFKHPPCELDRFGFSFEFPDYDTFTYGCGTRGCPGCEGDSHRLWAACSETENALNVRFLFLTNEEKIKEKAEIVTRGL